MEEIEDLKIPTWKTPATPEGKKLWAILKI
jgi:hypothetical protein